MKYVRKFNEDIESVKSIEDWCKEFELEDYTINIDNTIYVNSDVDITGRHLQKIPIQFGIVNGNFDCFYNELTSLEGCPKIVNYGFSCSNNNLSNLIGGPKICKEVYLCRSNQLISLEGAPEELGPLFSCIKNPINEIFRLFKSYKAYKDSLDYNYLRGTNIIKLRFQEACDEARVLMPKSFIYYKYI